MNTRCSSKTSTSTHHLYIGNEKCDRAENRIDLISSRIRKFFRLHTKKNLILYYFNTCKYIKPDHKTYNHYTVTNRAHSENID